MEKISKLLTKKKSDSKKAPKSRIVSPEILDEPEFSNVEITAGSVKCSKISFTHKWTLTNYPKFYDEKHLWKSVICSADFSPPNNEQFVFALMLYPFTNDGISVSLNSLALPNMYDGKIKCQRKVSIVNENGEICYSNECVWYDIFQWNGRTFPLISIDKFVESIDEFMPNNSLTLYFKIHLQAEECIFNVPKSNGLRESWSDGSTKVTRLAYTWTIENVGRLFEGSDIPWYIQSDSFPSNRSSGNNKSDNFHLRLYPNGFDAENADCVDIGVVKDNDATVHCKISIFDVDGDKPFVHEQTRKTVHYRGFIEKFINRDELLNPAKGMLNDNKLRILCEMSYMTNLIDESSLNMRFNEYENTFKLESNFDVEQKSFRFVDHRWSIEKFASLYCQNVITTNDGRPMPLLISKVFSSSKDSRIKFGIHLFPYGEEEKSQDYMVLYLARASQVGENFPVEVAAQFQLSILTEDGEKYTQEAWHKVMHKGEWEHRLQFIRRDFIFDPKNGLLPNGNLTILCEIWIINDQKMYSTCEENVESTSKANASNIIYLGNATSSFININGNAQTGNVSMKKF